MNFCLKPKDKFEIYASHYEEIEKKNGYDSREQYKEPKKVQTVLGCGYIKNEIGYSYLNSLKRLTDDGENILFSNIINKKYKDLLIKLYPEELERTNYYGRDILHYEYAADPKHKNKLIKKKKFKLQYK